MQEPKGVTVLVEHDKNYQLMNIYESSIVDRLIPKGVTTEALESLGDTLNFIDIFIKLLEENYEARRVANITAMKEMFKKISLTMIKALTPEQKVQKFMT